MGLCTMAHPYYGGTVGFAQIVGLAPARIWGPARVFFVMGASVYYVRTEGEVVTDLHMGKGVSNECTTHKHKFIYTCSIHNN